MEWQPIATAPRTAEVIMVLIDGKHHLLRSDDLLAAPVYLMGRKVTHWMRLPAPPKENPGG